MNDDELIAKFMGLQWDSFDRKHVDYQNDWNCLMPVVEKIAAHIYESREENNGYKNVMHHDRAYPRTFAMLDNNGKWMVRINRMPLEQEDTLILATYNAVVYWIKSNENNES